MTINEAKEEAINLICKNCKIRTEDCFDHCSSLLDFLVGFHYGYKRGKVDQMILQDVENGKVE